MTPAICAVIPSYNHHTAIEQVIACLRKNELPVIVVDDGSGEETKFALFRLHNPDAGVQVFRREINGGKGAAVMTGFEIAAQAGYSHVLQIDADGQHDTSNLPEFISLAEKYPNNVIAGVPVYDSSVPLARRLARWLTHIWVWIETLSFRIQDSMCGFRIYPLDRVAPVIARDQVRRHMDFDIEILVRLFWAGTAPIGVSVNVSYPDDNTSNFNLFWDNWRIIKLHTHLMATLLLRLPSIIKNRPASIDRENVHWSEMQERGSMAGLLMLAAVYRVFGKKACRWMLEPVLAYFFLTGREQRKGIAQYLTQLRKEHGLAGGAKLAPSLSPISHIWRYGAG